MKSQAIFVQVLFFFAFLIGTFQCYKHKHPRVRPANHQANHYDDQVLQSESPPQPAQPEPPQRKNNCHCPTEYSPVCGFDFKTYRNSCELHCRGVVKFYDGKCHLYTHTTPPTAEGCDCPFNWDPVCGTDSHTYPNKCIQECYGTPVAHDGECYQQSQFFRP